MQRSLPPGGTPRSGPGRPATLENPVSRNAQHLGLSAALTTPFTADGAIDHSRMTARARRLIERGCGSVTLFGTTGEGASVGLAERTAVLAAFRTAGFDFRREVVVGVLASALPDAGAMVRQALDHDARAVMVAPPFFFKNPSDDGVHRWYAALFDQVGPALRDVILYHIPSVTSVPVPPTVVRRLAAAYPGAVLGVKDSSGDRANTWALLELCRDLQILVGDERQLAAAVRGGGAGAISGLANVLPERLRTMAVDGVEDAGVSALVDALLQHPVVPAVKALVAADTLDEAWLRPRPPLLSLPDRARVSLEAALEAVVRGRAA